MTMVITGSNSGIGYETARSLASDTTQTIVLAGRNLARLDEAVQRIKIRTGNENLFPMLLDLASLTSVRTFSNELRKRKLPPLTTVICNAGISKPTVLERSTDGYELTFAVNHLGHFLLVNLLLDYLQPPGRIIFVSSGAHDPEKAQGPMQPPHYIKAEWLAYPRRDRGIAGKDAIAGGQAYASSKLCNLLCTYELKRQLEMSGVSTSEKPITVNAFDPGMVAGTGLGRYEKPMMRFAWYYILPTISHLMGFGRTPAQAGADLAYLATAPELENLSGKFFSGRKIIPSSVESYDQAKADDLWLTSFELCRLQPNESPLMKN